MQNTDLFDPISELFVANFERPGYLEEINLRALTPFQRALLVIDGTVTKFIEAFTMEPVEIILLDQVKQNLTTEHRLLKASKGTVVIARQVLLQGKYSNTFYAYASSLIVPDRLRITEKKKLEVPGEGLGRILLESQMEQYRELLWFGKEYTTELPEAISHFTNNGFLSRTYRISSGRQPIMLINEKFPCLDNLIPFHH